MSETPKPTLRRAERATTPGLHIMRCSSMRRVETLTALGATGVHMILAWGMKRSAAAAVGHPLVPTLSVELEPGLGPEGDGGLSGSAQSAADIILPRRAPSEWPQLVLDRLSETASGRSSASLRERERPERPHSKNAASSALAQAPGGRGRERPFGIRDGIGADRALPFGAHVAIYIFILITLY